MSTYSMPTNQGSTGHGLSWKLVRVSQLFPDQLTALVVDQFGKGMEIRYDIMATKGLLPAPGENWIVEHKYGRWVFGAIVTGGNVGVGIDNVNGLTNTLSAVATSLGNINTSLNGLTARADKNQMYYKHLWNSGGSFSLAPTSGTVVGNPVLMRDGGIATFSGNNIQLNREGRWALNLVVEAFPTVDGRIFGYMSFGADSPATGSYGYIIDSTLVGAAYGYGAVNTSWTGWVTPAQAAATWNIRIGWATTTTGTSVNVGWLLGCEYLGPF